MATLYAKTAGGNWSAAATWSAISAGGADSVGPPAITDDVVFELLSGNVTIDAASSARSVNTTSGTGTYGGILTHNAFTLTIGDSTAPAGNVALKLNSGMTYTLSNGTTSAILFSSTNSTQQTIDYGGKTAGGITFTGAGANWAIISNITTAAQPLVTSGIVHFDGITDNAGLTHNFLSLAFSSALTRTLRLGNCTINVSQGANAISASTTTNLTFTADTSTINLTGPSAGINIGGTTGNGVTFATVNFTGGGSMTIAAKSNTFGTLAITGSASKTDNLSTGQDQTITGVLKLAGNSPTNRLFVRATAIGTPVVFNITGAAFTGTQNVDFRDITFSTGTTNLSAITGGAGDAGGNSGITFTTPATQTFSGTVSDSWSTNAWSGRVPLPQDDVLISSAFSSGQTVTIDMPRIGKSVNFSGMSWTGTATTISANTIAMEVYGSLTLKTGMAFTVGSTGSWTYMGRGAFTITSAGNSFGTAVITINAFNGAYSLLDALTSSSVVGFSTGAFNSNNFNFTLGRTSIFAISSVVSMGTSIWTLTNNSITTPWVAPIGSLFADSSTIVLSAATASYTFTGNGKTYNDLKVNAGSGTLTISGANTFNRIYTDGLGNKSIVLPGSTTTTIVSGQGLANGTNIITFTASAGSATVSKSGGGTVSWDYVNLTNIPAVQSSTWYAGTHSTDGNGNTNWIFTDPPVSSTASGNLRDRLATFFITKTGINNRKDAERAFWNNNNLDFS